MNEFWLPTRFENIEVSNLGNVRKRKGDETVLRHIIVPRNKYPFISQQVSDGRSIHVYVHLLVLETFVGPRPAGYYARHLNDIKTDNRLENLCWGTPSENAYDRVRNGHHFQVAKTHCKHGHEFTPENTYRNARGNRVCKSCRELRVSRWIAGNEEKHRERTKAYREAHKEEQRAWELAHREERNAYQNVRYHAKRVQKPN